MNGSLRVVFLIAVIAVIGAGCARTATAPPVARPAPCDARQAGISREADLRARPWGIGPHLARNFPDQRIAWLMKEGLYQTYVVQARATRFGRCVDGACYLFAAPAATIRGAVQAAMKDGRHDPAVLGQRLGLPAVNFEGALRLLTLDLRGVCARLPVEADPGVWKCQSPADRDCFRFGGYTSGGVPELMVIDAPVARAEVAEVP